MTKSLSWGRYPRIPQYRHSVFWPEEIPSTLQEIFSLNAGGTLAFGMGRSYGDSCLAESNHVVAMQSMDRVINVDWSTGILQAQAGLSLIELIRLAVPHGWFLPVTPGTQFVTLGGAVANDVHGKNHHVMGTFGCHVRRLVLYRSDEGVIECSQSLRPEIFAATIGGLGLSGVILAVELQLRRIQSSNIRQRSIRFGNLDEFFELSRLHDVSHEYTVAWIDCLAKGAETGRGHYLAGNHADDGILEVAKTGKLFMPVDPPVSLINSLSLRLFNTFYYHRQRQKEIVSCVSYSPFFYPLDKLLYWNRIYGRKGFQQYQCVVPQQHAREVIGAIMAEIANSGTGSFLAVLKQCGEMISPGLLSFPMQGVSLALDFPQREPLNKRLFNRLDALVHECGGRLYPAKDAHMTAIHFKKAYPHWDTIESLRDPQLMSHFWKRVTK